MVILVIKKRLATVAEIIDLWKITRRSAIIFFGYVLWNVVCWYLGLENPTTQQTTFVSIVIGAYPPTLAFYTAKGVDWSKFHSTNRMNNNEMGYRRSEHHFDNYDYDRWEN